MTRNSIRNSLAIAVALLMSTSVAYASEITGSLSSGGAAQTTGNSSASISGTVTSGAAGAGTTGGGSAAASGGSTGGNGPIVVGGVGGGSTVAADSSQTSGTSESAAPSGFVLGSAAEGSVEVLSSEVSDESQTLAAVDTGEVTQNQNGTAAVIDSGFAVSTWLWAVLLLVAVLAVIYYLYARYKEDRELGGQGI